MKSILTMHKSYLIFLILFLQVCTVTIAWAQQCPNVYETWWGEQDDFPCGGSSCRSDATKEILYYQEGQKDPNAGFTIFPSNSTKVLKLGDQSKDYSSVYVMKQDPGNLLTDANNKIMIRYALVIQAKPNSGTWVYRPNFSIVLQDAEYINCRPLMDENFTGFKKNGNYYYMEWTTILVDLSTSNLTVFPSIVVDLSPGVYKNESGIDSPLAAYAYIDVQCAHPQLNIPSQVCKGESVSVTAPIEANNAESFTWNSGDGVTSTGKKFTHTYANEGTYTLTMTYGHDNDPDQFCKASTFQAQVAVVGCKPPPQFVCETCIPDFSPLPGERYTLSAWVRQGNGVGYSSYASPAIQVNFMQGTITEKFRAAGLIVDGWQQINGEFIVPDDAKKISILLFNDNESEEVFFDDIRIQPFNSSMKAFVYDPVTLRLAAELDERNYASFFEYDEEGGLVRVKKETERGIKTISEARTSMRKRKPAAKNQ